MRAWPNKLSNVNPIIVLPLALIFVVFGIALTHSQASQTQPVLPKSLSIYQNDSLSVQPQEAYSLPPIAVDYTGHNTPQPTINQVASSTPSIARQSSNPNANATSNKPVSPSNPQTTSSASSNANPNSLKMIMNTLILRVSGTLK